MTEGPIGGFFAWDEPGGGAGGPSPGAAFRSARSALAAFLALARPARIWVPHYVCGAVVDAVAYAGILLARYPLAPDLGLPADLAVAPDDWVLVVDYLGLASGAVARATTQVPAARLVVDASQALHRERMGDEALLYSPRKTLPLPDGGWIDSPAYAASPSGDDEAGSDQRAEAMRLRAAGDLPAGYAQYQAAEASLADPAPLPMSHLTRGRLAHADLRAIASARLANHAQLARGLAARGVRVRAAAPGEVPLYTPVPVVDAAPVRRMLATLGVFSPMFWPDADVPADDLVGRRLRDHTLYLPCDQRYDSADMQRVLASLDHAMEQAGHRYMKD
jgi:hypothetical protein